MKQIKAVFLSFILVIGALGIMTPNVVQAEEKTEEKVVRVGWHEEPYFITDENGRKSGYSYDYQRKVAAYTGWTYEYIEGSWAELFEMLKKGEIDILTDVSYTEERAKEMLFSSIPMGTESYYIYTSPGNKEISADNLSALNGKKVGVTAGTIQKELFLEWADSHDIDVELVERTTSDDESIELLGTDYDAYVTLDVYGTPETAIPVCKIGSSDFFFAVSKDRPDLLTELDAALNSIQDENKYYDQQLHDKYLSSTEAARFLSVSEQDWLENHGTIKVGYQDNYLAFCTKDSKTGKLTGALKDYLDSASGAFLNADIKFEPVCYPTSGAALDALGNGEIDCVFPANLTEYDAEEMDLAISPMIMHSEMLVIVKPSKKKDILKLQDVTVAINEGDTNYDMFLPECFPTWKKEYFKNTSAGIDAVADGKVDCILVSNYRYNNVAKHCESHNLAAISSGVDMNFCFAVREGDNELYSILAKSTNIVPDSIINSALNYYSSEDAKTTFGELIKENIVIILSIIILVLVIILMLIIKGIRAKRRIKEEEHLVKDLNKKVFVDALTSVRNKGAFDEDIQRLQDSLEQGEQLKLAIGIFDCNDLKKINDRFGHDKGDIYLKKACELICNVFVHSPVFRIGGDEFAVILENDNFENREELLKQFETKRRAHNESVYRKWEEVNIACGVADFDLTVDHSINNTIKRADKVMYENKRSMKESN